MSLGAQISGMCSENMILYQNEEILHLCESCTDPLIFPRIICVMVIATTEIANCQARVLVQLHSQSPMSKLKKRTRSYTN